MTSGCGTTSAGRCLTAERVGARAPLSSRAALSSECTVWTQRVRPSRHELQDAAGVLADFGVRLTAFPLPAAQLTRSPAATSASRWFPDGAPRVSCGTHPDAARGGLRSAAGVSSGAPGECPGTG
jgi:hypothetical protein